MESNKTNHPKISMLKAGSELEKQDINLELMEKSRKLDHIFNHSRDGMTLSDQNGNLVEINQACSEIFELDMESIHSKKIGHHVAPEGIRTFQKMRRHLVEEGYVIEKLPVILENGKLKFIELSITYKAYRDLNLSIIRDVTEEQLLLNKLTESEDKLTNIFENALDGILIWNPERMIVDANPAACKLFNISLNEIKTYHLFDFLEGKNISIGKTFQEKVERHGEVRGDIQFTMPDGEKKQLEFTTKKSAYGNLYLTIYRDITHTKQMIQELQQSEERFRQLFERALDGMAILDHNGYIVNVNESFCQIFEVDKDLIISTHYSHLENGCDITWDNPAMLGRSGEGKRHRQSTGEKQYFSFTLSYEIYPNHHLVIIREVTEIKNAEADLRKTETTNVLGDLAASVAHEIRNPLSTVKGFLQLLDGNEAVNQELLKVVGVEMQQLEEIVNEFLLLSKREFVSYEVVNLNEMLAELVEDLSQKAADRKINIVEAYGSIDVEYRCIRSHIKQVMMNLINNGIESMPNGGQLKTKLLKTENGEILIEVEDHGDGIPDHLINRLGEPYYQTSEKGTGLGLMVSYKVIKEHGGHIEVTSKKHEGTVFLIKLPANPSFVHMEKEE
ncbi:PAS domain S-box protein [Bacillus hwajinpoensis]|uniref:histidine kinase n=1 Tax=Guptibacillus hwajinpoensis TaxID=208199 RepID=A0A845EYB1_9BACL|nr:MULTISPECIES: PAS domain-containing sensor histidine kinase [Bacillaceae]MYL63592.1 PAS domain S-box protein [Pseudalkalibacillus hwajinpoensis]PFG12775.1 two-component system, sporulation sensor kinase E [Bacillus sp. es.036]